MEHRRLRLHTESKQKGGVGWECWSTSTRGRHVVLWSSRRVVFLISLWCSEQHDVHVEGQRGHRVVVLNTATHRTSLAPPHREPKQHASGDSQLLGCCLGVDKFFLHPAHTLHNTKKEKKKTQERTRAETLQETKEIQKTPCRTCGRTTRHPAEYEQRRHPADRENIRQQKYAPTLCKVRNETLPNTNLFAHFAPYSTGCWE